MTKANPITLSLLLATGLSVALLTLSSSAQSDKKTAEQSPAAGSLKISILPFTDATGSGGADVGASLSRMAQAEFTHSTAVTAYALGLGDVRAENMDSQKAVEIGRAHNVNAVILGTILEAQTENTSRGGGSTIFGQTIGGNLHMSKATVIIQGDLFDTATGAKIDSFRVTGKEDQKRADPSAYTRLGDINGYNYNLNNSALGRALQKAVADLVKKVVSDEPKMRQQRP